MMNRFALMAEQFPKGVSPESQALFNGQGEELSLYLALVRSGGLKLSDYQAMHLAVMMWCAKNQESTVDFKYAACLTAYTEVG